jgi:hypothetical protein
MSDGLTVRFSKAVLPKLRSTNLTNAHYLPSAGNHVNYAFDMKLQQAVLLGAWVGVQDKDFSILHWGGFNV